MSAIISTHVHPGDPGQLVLSGQPRHLPAHSTSPHSLLICANKMQSLGDQWLLTHSGLLYRASLSWVFPEGPTLSRIRSSLRLGSEPFPLPHHTAYSFLTPSCRIAVLQMAQSVLKGFFFFFKEKMSRLSDNSSPEGERGDEGLERR